MYGDGITLANYRSILHGLISRGYSVENISFGVGSIMYYNNRDTLQFAVKATLVVVNGEERQIVKNPITDRTKKSKKGYLKLIKHINDSFETVDKVSKEEEDLTYLTTVFKDGIITKDQSLYEIQDRVNNLFNTECLNQIDQVVCLIGNDCSGKTTLCKRLLSDFYNGQSRVLPIERSIIFGSLLLNQLKAIVNPSKMDEILHMCSFEERPDVENIITFMGKIIKVYYIIVDASIPTLIERSAMRSEHDKYESEKAFR
jgi:hypothetical protein